MKIISLTQGYKTIVDAEDYDRLVAIGKWHAHKLSETQIYAVRGGWRGSKIQIVRMHRIITNAPKGFDVDHINGDCLDNRKVNLRICTRSQNAMNRGSLPGSSSKFKGISWYPRYQKWLANIKVNGKKKYLGYFENEIEAAKAYDEAAKKYHGKFAHLNFPDDDINRVALKKQRRRIKIK